jgi:hypothetical protein
MINDFFPFQQNRVRWIFVLDGEDSVFADAVAEGCCRLYLDNNFDVVIYETLKFEDIKPTVRLFQQDEFVEPEEKYFIVERTVYDNGTNDAEPLICSSSSTQCLSPPRQSTYTSIRQTPSASNHQNGSNDVQALIWNSSATPRLSLSTRQSNNDPSFHVTPPRQPTVFHPFINPRQHESATLSETFSVVLVNALLSSVPRADEPQIPPVVRFEQSRTHRLAPYYLLHTAAIDTAFESYTPRQPLVFLNTNLYERFNQRALVKAAVYILRSKADPQLNYAAHYVICQCLKDIIKEDRPAYDIPHAELEALPPMVNTLTSTTLFFNLIMKNHQGILDRNIRRQRQNTPTRQPKLKHLPIDNLQETLEEYSSTNIQNLDLVIMID